MAKSNNLSTTIPDGATEPTAGSEVPIGNVLVGLILPASMTGTTVTFLTATTLAGTYVAIQDGEGTDYSVTIASSKYVPVDPVKFLGARFLKIKSGTAETGAKVVTLVTREM